MSVRQILTIGDPRLLRVAQPVTEFGTDALRGLVQDLFDTLHAAGGAGIAAPQIGVDLRVVVFGFERLARYPDAPPVPRTVLVNPVLEPLDAELVEGWEGCLSVPGLRGPVPRHQRIRYRALDVDGRPIEREVSGFHAVVVQHETDHLLGRLFPSRMRAGTQPVPAAQAPA